MNKDFWNISMSPGEEEELKNKLKAIGINETFISGSGGGSGTAINHIPRGLNFNSFPCAECQSILCNINSEMHGIHLFMGEQGEVNELFEVEEGKIALCFYIYANNRVVMQVDDIIIKEYNGGNTIFNYFDERSQVNLIKEEVQELTRSINEMFSIATQAGIREKLDLHHIYVEGCNG